MTQTTIEQAMHSALDQERAGKLPEAEQVYRQVLNADPKNALALYRLGVLSGKRGRSDLEIDLIQRAVHCRPDFLEAHNSLGIALNREGRMSEAVREFQTASRLKPDSIEIRLNLGKTLGALGKWDEAVATYRAAITMRADFAQAHNDLGYALLQKGALIDAVLAFAQAIGHGPDYAEAHSNLGVALAESNRLAPAVTACTKAIDLKPDFAEGFNNLGLCLARAAFLEKAADAYRRAVELRPDYPQALSNLSSIYLEKGDADQAISLARRAIAAYPNFAEAYNNLGNALLKKGELENAAGAFRKALGIRPKLADTWNNLGNTLAEGGEVRTAMQAFEQAIACAPDEPRFSTNRLFHLHLIPEISPQKIFHEHLAWAAKFTDKLGENTAPHVNVRDPNRRLKIGYVSPDFREHSVAHFLDVLFAERDRDAVEIYCYADLRAPDAITARFESLADAWRETTSLSDAQVAEDIRGEGIDILVDLAGHTAGNRLLTFARKPAPIQVTYLGYPDTTGMRAMDYRITDAHADPPGSTEAFYTEKLLRLPESFLCFSPPEDAPEIAPSPFQKSGHVTFGCFAALSKINESLERSWCKILSTVADSRMILKTRGLADAAARARLLSHFRAGGIEPNRIDFRSWSPTRRTHLETYGQIDIALDTFPYHGTTVSCEALWMGVPLVTLAGKTHVQRVGVSLLNNVGLPELVVTDALRFVEIAVELAKDRDRLKELRCGLRQRVASSPLTDRKKFAASLQSAYRTIWQTWCAGR